MADETSDKIEFLKKKIAELEARTLEARAEQKLAPKPKKIKEHLQRHKSALKKISKRVTKLERRKKQPVLRPTVEFKASINRLNDNLQQLFEVLGKQQEDLGHEKEILLKLEQLLAQNEKIAQGILAIADLINSRLVEKRHADESDSVFGEVARAEPAPQPAQTEPLDFGIQQGFGMQAEPPPVDLTSQSSPGDFPSYDNRQELDSLPFAPNVQQQPAPAMTGSDLFGQQYPQDQYGPGAQQFSQQPDDTIRPLQPADPFSQPPPFQPQPSAPPQSKFSLWPFGKKKEAAPDFSSMPPPQSPPMPDFGMPMQPPQRQDLSPIQSFSAPQPPSGRPRERLTIRPFDNEKK